MVLASGRVRRRAVRLSSSAAPRLAEVEETTAVELISESSVQFRLQASPAGPSLFYRPASRLIRDLGVLALVVLGVPVEWRLRITSPDKEGFNWSRTIRMATFGLAAGPILSGWYRTLALMDTALKVNYAPLVGGWLRRALNRDGSLPSTLFPFLTLHIARTSEVSRGQVLAAKVVADNLLFQAPFLNLYFLMMGALEGLHPVDILAKTKESFHQAWALSILVWVPVQVVNLGLVPIAYQAVVVSLVNVGWKTALSLLNHYHRYHVPPPVGLQRHDSELHRHNADLASQVTALCAENEELRRKLKLRERTH